MGGNFFSHLVQSHSNVQKPDLPDGARESTFHASGVIPAQPLWDLLTTLTNLTLQNKKLGSREVKRHHEQQSPDGELEFQAPSSLLLIL